jgi:NhaP-type Na+/H+ or K+/H+ antiporter
MKGAINLFHMIFVVLLFLYLGSQIYMEKKLPKELGLGLILLAIVIFIYHLYRYRMVTA